MKYVYVKTTQFVWLPTLEKRFCGVLDSFILFLKKFDERKTYNMLVLMLEPRFKSLRLVFSFIGHDQRVAMVEQYILCSWNVIITCIYRKNLIMVLLTIGYFSNDIKEYWINTKKLVKRVLLVFWHYQMDVKEIKCPLQWWDKHEAMFPTIGFLVH